MTAAVCGFLELELVAQQLTDKNPTIKVKFQVSQLDVRDANRLIVQAVMQIIRIEQ